MVDIRPFDLQNVTLHYKWNQDEELDYDTFEGPNSMESFESFLRYIKSVVEERNGKAKLFEIYSAENNKLIGIVNIHDINHENKRCFVKCLIGNRDYADKGCEITALHLVLRYCFNELGMNKVCTSAFTSHESWINGVQQLGFKKEGELRNHILTKEKYRNRLIFGLLADEYENVRKNPKLRAVN